MKALESLKKKISEWASGKKSVNLYPSLVILLTFLAFFLPLTAAQAREKPAPKVRNGVIDLAGWNFERNGGVALSGEWEFYWDRLLSPKDFAASPPAGSGDILVPGTWNDVRIGGKKIGSRGFATYRLRIEGIPAKEALALRIPRIYSAAKIWVDGKQAFKVGIVAKTKDNAKPGWATEVVPLPTGQTQADVVMQVSNFRFRSGGVEDKLILGERSGLVARRHRDLFYLLLIAGGMLVMGLYHLVLFLVRRQDPATLYLGLIFLLQCIFQLLSYKYFLFSTLSSLSWAFLYKGQLTSYFATMAFTLLFLRTIFPDESSQQLTRLHVSVSTLFILAALALPVLTCSHLEPVYDGITVATLFYLTYVVIAAAAHGRQGGRVMLGGLLALFAAIGHDILGDYGLVANQDMVLFAEFLILIAVSFFLAIRFSAAFTTVERQEATLERLNIELDSKVRERTAGLQKTVREKEALLREVHHRVKNNMQVIVSLLNLQSDKLGDRAASRALEESRDRIRSMMLIHENLYLSDDLEMIDFGSYAERIVSEIFCSYGLDKGRIDYAIDASGVTLDLDCAVPCGLVLNELTTNAIKHAFRDGHEGKITVEMVREDPGEYLLTIADNGIGLSDDIDRRSTSTLGLRLVHGLVERQLGGAIEISGKNGAKFSIRFSAPTGGV